MRDDRRRQLRHRVPTSRALMFTRFSWLVVLLACVSPTVAFAQPLSSPARGFGIDMELEGGVGFGLQHQLDNDFLGRLRLGALYFDEPLVYALGVTAEVGGLAEYGLGVALEVSHFDGPWARIGGSRVVGDEWMTQLTLGFLFFGLEWQHRIDARDALSDSLMLVFRLPVGVWWFMTRDRQPTHGSLPPQPPQEEPLPRAPEAVASPSPEAPHAVLRLRVEPLADNETVWLDDQPLSIDALGYPVSIAPGPHVIVVKRADAVVLRVEVSAEVGDNVSLKLDPSQPDEGSGVDVRTGAGEPPR